ncbi:MerR family transcriptional regulator [Marinomonas sp.]
MSQVELESFIANEHDNPTVALFPIRDLSLKTGVNSVTLRAWERRYGLLKPQRTAKGHRLYSEADIKQVEAILYWVQQGVAVSKVRALIEKGAEETPNLDSDWQLLQTSLINAAKAFNADKIHQLCAEVLSQYPASIAVQNWLLPSLALLAKGVEGSFCEAVVSEELTVRLHGLKKQHGSGRKALVGAAAGGSNLWGIMASFILADQGVSCEFVSNLASADDCVALSKGLDVSGLMVFCGNEQASQVAGFVAKVQQPNIPVVLVGAKLWLAYHESKVDEAENVAIFSDPIEGVQSFLTKIS